MRKDTGKRKEIKLPNVGKSESSVQLPFNGKAVENHGFSFSFSCLDRSHEFFNLGGNSKDGTVGGKWFLRLLDCLKSVSGKTVEELSKSTHDFHRVDWDKANVRCPTSNQAEYWQFRIDKSHGRVIGILIDAVFYVVWLDPYHNLSDSEGYGGVKKFPEPKLK